MKLILLTLLCALVLSLALLPALASGQAVTIVGGKGHLGTPPDDFIVTGRPILFNLRFQNPDLENRFNITNGFRLYSPDGALWHGPVEIDTLVGEIPRANWDIGWAVITRHSATEDTIGIGGLIAEGIGIPQGFDGVPYAIRIGGFDVDQAGLTLCIDSVMFWPVNRWNWITPGGLKVYPAWGGPYCFTIVVPHCDPEPACLCCDWYTGNVDGDANDLVDIADLSAMVAFLFSGGTLSGCPNENNVDASLDGAVDMSDLQLLIEHLFSSAYLPGCPYTH